MRFLSTTGLFALIVSAAGCGGPPELGGPKYDYGNPNMEQTAARFHADPKSNRDPAAEKVPLKFVDTDGKPVDLAAYRGKSNVVLVVVKGLPKSPGGLFCPGCLAQVNALTASYAEFKARDAEILVVFPGPTDGLPQFLATAKVDGAGGNPKLPFALLTDTDLKAVDGLGIRGDLAKPSTYILDKKGSAVFAFVGETTTDRPSVKALLAQLDKVNGKK
ncbi:MAG: peroxiredoxin family protein [Planctomycetes bacterium]|nr:peroxiredoxin family protein [Planctomycetota bacterium]